MTEAALFGELEGNDRENKEYYNNVTLHVKQTFSHHFLWLSSKANMY